MKEYEVVIIGGGPAGLTAGLYTARARLKCLLIEKGVTGGMITYASQVDNFPGFPDGISGVDLTGLMEQQARKYGLEIISTEVTGIELEGERKVIATTGGDFTAKAVIIASGSERQKLGIPGEDELTGRGVSSCAICDGFFFTDKPVAVAGGGNAAINEALDLTKFASRVTVIHRRGELRATRVLQEKALADPKIDFLWNTVIEEIEGKDAVKQLKLRNSLTGEKSALELAGIFISVGLKPSTDFVKGLLALDEKGYIITNERMETEIPGILAAGDVRCDSARQTITAAGDGATAAIYAEGFLSG
ncbi:thioredoxin-disulfide reductase [Chloroflexota bacterium]